MELEKYHGLGNAYLVYDPQKNEMALNQERIRLICDANFGVGSDGILFGPLLDHEKIAVRIYNPDGSEAEKSGNGVRIFAKYLRDAAYVDKRIFTLATLGGEVEVEYLNGQGDLTKVFMGKPTYQSSRIPVSGRDRQVVNEPMAFGGQSYQVTCLSIGNPHCVIPMEEVTKEKACELGRQVERSAHFPNRINMQLLKVIDKHNIRIEIFERGAGYTLASGSSSCAAASAAHKLGLADSPVTVHMPGGTLQIEILPDESVYMTGKVAHVGSVALSAEFIRELCLLGE